MMINIGNDLQKAYDEGYEARDSEIVRCKDCRYNHQWYSDRSICDLWSETGVSVFNDGFCSYGKRRENEID